MDLEEKWDFFLKWLSKVSPFSPINTAAENLRDLHREEISGLKARILELESSRAAVIVRAEKAEAQVEDFKRATKRECDSRFIGEECSDHACYGILDPHGGNVANSCERHLESLMSHEKGVKHHTHSELLDKLR